MTPEEIWLNYFNRVLFGEGLIDENTKNKMNYLIYKKYHDNHRKGHLKESNINACRT